jgi:hypothetical protein
VLYVRFIVVVSLENANFAQQIPTLLNSRRAIG